MASQESKRQLTPEMVKLLLKKLSDASWKGPKEFANVCPRQEVLDILQEVLKTLSKEPTLVDIFPSSETRVVVVGDTHGQFHDVLKMFQTVGEPSETCHYIFNGDFVDRGVWGLEVLLCLFAWKLAFPHAVTLLRGNHETTTCTMMYGFKVELSRKFGAQEGKIIYSHCKKVFAVLPLAARIAETTLVLHGGLFRKPTKPLTGKNRRKRTYEETQCVLGGLDDLRGSGKGGMDPNGKGSTVVATDVLWSDPVLEPGLQLNDQRGIGVVFGPDITELFLKDNSLTLILRSHEGPDARVDREDLATMDKGWTLDHDTPAGKLYTIFSAPDYPQFQPEDAERHENDAAVAVLTAPTWDTPKMVQFQAVLPRPPATACYDFVDIPGSDDEMDILGDGSDVSQVSSHSAACADDVDAELTSHHIGDPDYNPMDSVTKDATGSGRGKSAQLSSSNKPKKPGRPRKKAVAQTGANGMEEGAGLLASGHLCAGLPQNQLKEVVEHPDSTMASEDCQTEQHPLPSTENRRSRRLSLQRTYEAAPTRPAATRPKKQRADLTSAAEAAQHPVAHPNDVVQPERLPNPQSAQPDASLMPVQSDPAEPCQATSLEDQPYHSADLMNGAVHNPTAAHPPALHDHRALEAKEEDSGEPTVSAKLAPSTEAADSIRPAGVLGKHENGILSQETHHRRDLQEEQHQPDPHEDVLCTPDMELPIHQIANPGRELEQAAALTLATVGGLQQLSDTPEPAFLRSLVASAAGAPDTDTCPPAGCQDPSPIVSKSIITSAEEGQLIEEGEPHDGPASQVDDALMMEHTGTEEPPVVALLKTEALKTRHKTKLPWR